MPILAKKIIFSDEAHFDIGGYVNKQNCRIWGIENPLAYIEKLTHPKQVTVWCGFWSRGIIGPFFSQNVQGEAITVNGNSYCAILNEFLLKKKLKRRILDHFSSKMCREKSMVWARVQAQDHVERIFVHKN